MDITYLGHSSFRIKGRATAVVTDPFDSQMTGLKFPKVEGDIVTISHDHKDHNRADLVKGVRKVFEGPGEYEAMGVSIIGILSFHDGEKGEVRGKNTIYVFEMDGLRIVHLGDLGHPLSERLLEEIGSVDILMVPVGGVFTVDSKTALEVVSAIEPKFVIPMHYLLPGHNREVFSELSGVDEFLKSAAMPVETVQKLQVKKEDLMEEQNTKIVVLEVK